MSKWLDKHVEPCPICGGRVQLYSDHDDMLACGDCGYGMVYNGDESLEIHNRISRIVRSAKNWVKARDYYSDALDPDCKVPIGRLFLTEHEWYESWEKLYKAVKEAEV